MAKVWVEIGVKDNASSVIDNVTKKLGIFNKEGIAMGISFALVNKAIDLAQRGFQMLTDAIVGSIRRGIDLQYNLVLMKNTVKNFDVSINDLEQSLKNES